MTDEEWVEGYKKHELTKLSNRELLQVFTDLVLTVERVADENTALTEKQVRFTAVLDAILSRMN